MLSKIIGLVGVVVISFALAMAGTEIIPTKKDFFLVVACGLGLTSCALFLLKKEEL